MVIYYHSVSRQIRYYERMEKYPYLNEAVASVLARRRAELAMSKKRLSEQAFIERAYITGLEAGKWNVTLNVLFYLCDALGMAPEDFIREVMAEREKLHAGEEERRTR